MAKDVEWICEGCGRSLHPSSLTRVGIGVHHYDSDKDRNRDGLLNCGPVKQKLRKRKDLNANH